MKSFWKIFAISAVLLSGGLLLAASTWEGDVNITGTLTAGSFDLPTGSVVDSDINSSAAIARSKLALESKTIDVPLGSLKIWDSLQQLPATSSSDDLGWYAGTYATNSPLIRTADVKAAGAVTLRARFQIALPENYESAGTVTIRARSGMVTTAADTTATIDFECSEIGDATVGSDLVTTAATTVNSTTFANKDFSVTAGGLVVGDSLDVRVTISVNDAATATAVIGAISKLQIICQVRG